MRDLRNLTFTCCAMGLLCVAQTVRADHLITTNVQGGGNYWTGAIWRTNGVGTAVAPVAGNTYECVPNGTAIGNNQNETRIRNPYAAGTPSMVTFPGDSLMLDTNTEIRFKQIAAGNVPVCNFPGVNGNPGLILNGGLLNAGDDAIFTITGKVQVASQSYICPGNNDGANAVAARAFTIAADLSGPGTLVIFEAMTNNPQRISGTANTFSGEWIVKSGWLLGASINSLGTNSITIDPFYSLPVPPFSETAPVVEVAGPAVLEPMYDLNSAGRLSLVNGGMMRLHQTCAFLAVNIEGALLSPGPHRYSELLANYPGNFAPGGSGGIVVQPYGTLPVLPPEITAPPLPQMLYAGGTAHFSVTASGAGPFTYQWRKGGSNLSDGGNISGASSNVLTINNVGVGDVANYDVIVSNSGGPATSAAAALNLVSPTGEAYEAAILAAKPVVFYQLNETTDPAVYALAFDYVGGGVGTYGTGVQNGYPTYNVAGPSAEGFPGFNAGNKAALFANGTGTSRITVSPWNLNTNTVTLTAWINPTVGQTQLGYEGLIFCRGSGTVAGLNYSGSTDVNGNPTLGYTWNNEWETWSWNSGLVPPADQWSFVALVVSPTNATMYLMNAGGIVASSHPYNHVVQGFGGTTLIGDDSNDGGNGTRVFSGRIDDVAVFNSALSQAQLLALYTAASGVSSFAPIIAASPVSQSVYAGQTVRFTVAGGGSEPLTYQWKKGVVGSGIYSNVSDDARTSGSTTPTLTIQNISAADGLDYIVILANSAGSATSAVATLTVQPTSPAENITLAIQQVGGNDWDTTGAWSDSLSATESAAAKPGSTYEVLAGARLRTPANPRTAIFPGNVLTIDGSSVWSNNPAAGSPMAEIRFKQPNPGTVVFPKLVMNGGQLDCGNDGIVEIAGEIDILTNAPIYNDSSNDRGYLISAQITGNGTIEYHGYNQGAFNANYVNNLNIAGSSNTFSGKWNVVLGTLLATGTNALGTNTITVAANGALETTYDVNNPIADLILNGRLYLHQNDTFHSVYLNGAPLPVGTYTAAQLTAAYPNNFPASWTPQNGANTFSNASGTLTVLVTPAPTIIQQPVSVSVYPRQSAQFTVAAQGTPPLGYQWFKGNLNLIDVNNILGAATTNLTISPVGPGDAGDYRVVVTNAIGSTTSVVATLTVLPTGPALNITLGLVQATGLDWDSPTNWSDGNPASLSAFSNPGSTYEVMPGARLRTPAGSTSAVFPGDVLTVDGDGVFAQDGANMGEIRFKGGNPGNVYFKKLVMNGGQLDSGVNDMVVIGGQMDIRANTPIYADTGSGQSRPWRIDAWLTGNGSIEFHDFDSTFSANLNIAGTSNTFSGKWNVVQGVLLGSAPNSLGTNDITVSANGALETTYDINNGTGSLILDGQMFLHQNDRFKSVVIAGTPLADGTYTFAQLTNAYPANFPASWPMQLGSGIATGSGSLIIGYVPPPQVQVQFQFNNGQLTFTWSQGTLLEADDILGPWRTNSSPSPFTIVPTEPKKFYRVQVQ